MPEDEGAKARLESYTAQYGKSFIWISISNERKYADFR